MTSTNRIIKMFYDLFCFGFVVLLIFVFCAAVLTMQIGFIILLIFLLCLVPWIFKSQKDVKERPTEFQRADERSRLDVHDEQIRALQEKIKDLEAQLNHQNDDPND